MEFDALDDDFGELYADVYVQPTYAEVDVQPTSAEAEVQPTSALENIDENIEEMSSDSSDELDIVLDDDNEYGSRVFEANEEIEPCELQFKNVDKEIRNDDGYAQHLIANGCNFTLPRSRTIFDVSVDSFDYKPWKHPGVDITDFFNFGFDEDTWKQYCNQLDTLRHQMSDGRYLCKPSRHNKISGRAIQVEECVIERQPSTNTWGPDDRDSDVVIQIALQDDLKEDLSTLANAGVDQTEVNYEGTLSDDAREVLCLSASEDDLSSLETDDEKSGNYTAESSRSDKQSPTSGFVTKHVEIDSGNSRTLDADVVCRSKYTDAVAIGEEMDTHIESGGSAERQLSDAAPSVLKPHLNQGDQNPHSVTPPRFCSHRGYEFDTYADSNISSNEEKLNLPNYSLEKRDSVTYHSYLSDDSNKYGVKSKRRRAFQTDLSFHGKKPIYVDDDASHLPAKEWFDDSRHSTINQKHNGLDLHTIKGTSYYKTSKSFPDYGGHRLSNSDSRDRYMKRPYWKGSSSKYDLDQNNRENINGKKRHFEQRPRVEHKEGRHGHLFDQRRHALQDMKTKPHGRFGQWQQKSDSYLEYEGGNQWKTEKHDWRFRKDVEHDDLLMQSNNKSSLTQGDDREPVSSAVCIRDSVQNTGHEHLSYSRRVKSSGWCSGRCDRAFNDLDEIQYTKHNGEKRGFTRRDSQIRPRSTCRQGLQSGSSPRNGMNQTRFRNRSNFSWAKKSYKNDHIGDYCFSDADVQMRNLDNQDCFVRRRESEERGVSHWNDEHLVSQRKDNEVLPSGLSYPYIKDQSRKSIDSQPGLDHSAKYTNHRHATQGRFRMSRGHIRGQFFQKPNVFGSGNYGNTDPKFRSSIDSYSFGVDRKYSGRSFRGGKMCNARNEYVSDDNCMKLKTYEDLDVDYPVNGNCSENLEVDQHGEFSNVEHNESEDIEEGQILSEQLKERAGEEINSTEDLRQIGENKNLYSKTTMDGNETSKGGLDNSRIWENSTEDLRQIGENKNLYSKTTMDGNETSKGGLDNPRIREILAKMERRRERFKRLISLTDDTEKATPTALHTDVETCNLNLQRPVRKRRWDGTPRILSSLT